MTKIPALYANSYRLACDYTEANKFLEIDPYFLKYIIERLGVLEETLRELLKNGEHEGDCTNEEPDTEGNYGPCWKHIAESNRREDAAKLVLDEIGCIGK
jgi:hypothetical protein